MSYKDKGAKILKLCEKADAQEPVFKKIHETSHFIKLCCPRCDTRLYTKDNYCRYCGQRLTWNNFKFNKIENCGYYFEDDDIEIQLD